MEVYISELCEQWKLEKLRNPEMLEKLEKSFIIPVAKETDLTGKPFFQIGNTKQMGMIVLDAETQTRIYFIQKNGKIFLLFGGDRDMLMVDGKFAFTLPEIDKMFRTRKYESFTNSHILDS